MNNSNFEIHHIEVDELAARKRWRCFRVLNKYLRLYLYQLLRWGWLKYVAPSIKIDRKREYKKRVLIMRPDHIGDLLMSLPGLLAIKKKLDPEYSFEILLNPCNISTIKRLGIFDSAYVFKMFSSEKVKLLPSFSEYHELASAIGAVGIVIDFRGDRHTKNLLYWMSKQSNHMTVYAHTKSNVPKYQSLYSFLVNTAAEMELDIEPDFVSNVKLIQQFLQQRYPAHHISQKPMIVICPDSRDVRKTWHEDEATTLIRSIEQRYGNRYSLVIVGTVLPNHFLYSEVIHDLRGKTNLEEVFEILNACQIFIGFDSGLTHYASMMGKATISIFTGHTDPATWAPIAVDNNLIVLQPLGDHQPTPSDVMENLTCLDKQKNSN
jgi:ADP-heptose:LPS heptosyltransferase